MPKIQSEIPLNMRTPVQPEAHHHSKANSTCPSYFLLFAIAEDRRRCSLRAVMGGFRFAGFYWQQEEASKRQEAQAQGRPCTVQQRLGMKRSSRCGVASLSGQFNATTPPRQELSCIVGNS